MTDQTSPLSHCRHAQWGWRPAAGFGFARRMALVALATVEIRRAAQVMPVAFCRQDGRWQAVGVMAPVAGANLLVARDGRWRAGFVPALLRAYPFCLDPMGALALWPGHPLLPLTGGADAAQGPVLPFFRDGTLTPQLADTRSFLRAVQAGIADADAVLAPLAEAAVLMPWQPPAGDRAGAAALPELWRLSPAAPAALGDATVLDLFRSGALHWLLAHADSLHHADRFRALSRSLAAPPPPAGPVRPDPAADILAALAEDLRETAP